MFDKLNLKDDYITVISDNRIIISWYNREAGKLIEYHCTSKMDDVNVKILSLTEAIRNGKTIRYEMELHKKNLVNILSNPIWFHDNETGEALLTHLKKVEALENELKDFIQRKITSQLQSPS